MTKTFTWVGAAAGDWQTASNWDDLTDGQSPSQLAPGAGDVAKTGSADIYGTGTVGILPEGIRLYGTLTAATVEAAVFVTNGGLLTADTADVTQLVVTGGTAIAGAATVNADFTAIEVSSAGAVAFNGSSTTIDGGNVEADTTSNITFGGAVATANAISIASGTTVTDIGNSSLGYGSFFGADGTGNYTDAIQVDGHLSVGMVDIDAPTHEANGYMLAGGVTGGGTIEVLSNDTAAIQAPVLSGSLSLQIDDNADLFAPDIVAAGMTVGELGHSTLDMSGTLPNLLVREVVPDINDTTLIQMSGGNDELVTTTYIGNGNFNPNAASFSVQGFDLDRYGAAHGL